MLSSNCVHSISVVCVRFMCVFISSFYYVKFLLHCVLYTLFMLHVRLLCANKNFLLTYLFSYIAGKHCDSNIFEEYCIYRYHKIKCLAVVIVTAVGCGNKQFKPYSHIE